MDKHFSKLTSKSQTVIPLAVRRELAVGPGDQLVYSKRENGFLIEKVKKQPEDDPFAVFTEWAEAADDDAYGKL